MYAVLLNVPILIGGDNMNKYEFEKWYYYDEEKDIKYSLHGKYTENYNREVFIIVGLYGNDGMHNVWIYDSLEMAEHMMDVFLDKDGESND